MLQLLRITVLLLACWNVLAEKDCSIHLKNFRKHAPIYVQSGRLMLPSSDTLHIPHNQIVTIACPGSGNHFKKHKKSQFMELHCNNGDFQQGAKTYEVESDLKCEETYPVVDIVDNSGSCGNREGSKKSVTFKFGSVTVPLYEVCYKTSKYEAIYTKHNLEAGWFQSGQPNDCPFKEYGTSAAALQIDKLYKKQDDALKHYIKGNLDTYWKKNKKFLARGHFAPCGDFHLDSSMSATYLYANAAPQWQDFNGGSWAILEEAIHKLIKNKKRNHFTIFTGASSEILRLPDDANNLHDIYLDTSGKQPVPKYFWKVVIDPDTNEGITFIGLNLMEGIEATHLDSLCTNICKATKWNNKNYAKPKQGLITCCSVREAKAILPRLSEVPTITKNLVNNK